MPRLTVGLGIVLILTSAVGYTAVEAPPLNLLVWAVFGAGILVCGVTAVLNDDARRIALYAATGLTAITFLATAEAVRFLLYLISVGPRHVPEPGVVAVRSIAAILCAVYLYFAARHFLDERTRRAE